MGPKDQTPSLRFLSALTSDPAGGGLRPRRLGEWALPGTVRGAGAPGAAVSKQGSGPQWRCVALGRHRAPCPLRLSREQVASDVQERSSAGGEGLTLLDKGEIGGFGCEEPQACSERPSQALGAGWDRERGRAEDGLLPVSRS